MARRIIATAEVQVEANIARAEAGLEDLTSAFRQIGERAERAAARAEVAWKSNARTIEAGFQSTIRESRLLIQQMAAVDDKGKLMAETFRDSLRAIQRMSNEDMDTKAIAALRLFKELYATTRLVEEGVHDDKKQMDRLAEAAREAAESVELIATETRQAERQAARLANAFRDVGHDMDLAMAGGLEGIEDSIRDTIRSLNRMGGEFRDVARIGAKAFSDITAEAGQADANIDDIISALRRLDSQLEGIEATELRRVEAEAEQAARALERAALAARRLDTIESRGSVAELKRLERQAERTERALRDMAQRTSGDVRGLISVLGAAGIGMAVERLAGFGLSMTIQLEKAEAMFLGLTGSIEGANDVLERLVTFARETPYNLGQVTDAAAQLLAVGDGFGVTADNIEVYLEKLGNAITMTGGSDEQFTRIVRVLGQMSSTGKVLGQDMNQLAQNLPGYNVWQALADGANTSVKELRRLQDLGKLDELLTGDEAVRILIDGMEQIPGAAGAMERRMQTLGGAIEKFKETAQLAMSQGLEPFAQTAQDTLSDPVILNSVENLSNAFGNMLSEGLAEVAPELANLGLAAEIFIDAIAEWAPVAGHVTEILTDVLVVVSPLISGLGKLADAALGAGDGMGKLGLAAGAFMLGGPVGVFSGGLLAISGALELVRSDADEAAASFESLMEVLLEGGTAAEEGLAQKIATEFTSLTGQMVEFGLTTPQVVTAIEQIRAGADVSSTAIGEFQRYLEEATDALDEPGGPGIFSEQGEAILDARSELEGLVRVATDYVEVTEEQATANADIAALMGTLTAEEEAYYDALYKNYQAKVDLTAAEEEYWQAKYASYQLTQEAVEVEEDNTEALQEAIEARRESIIAYKEWKDGVNEATRGVEASFSSLLEEEETTLAQMRENLRVNTMEQGAWKDDLATIMAELTAQGAEFGPEFAAWLAEAGLAGSEMVDEIANSPEEMQAVYGEWLANTEQANRDIVGEADALGDQLYRSMLASAQLGGEGFVQGIREYVAEAKAAVSALAGIVPTTIQGDLRMRSPSRVMWELGEYVVEGLIGGMQSMDAKAYATASVTASMLSGGIADHFRDAEDPQEQARKFAADIADTIIKELIAEQEAVADAAEALAEAAADRLAEAWDRVKDRFKARDMREAVAEAKAELADARSELAAAQSLAGTAGRNAVAAAEARLAKAEAAVANLRQLDAAADLAADQAVTDLRRRQEDEADALTGAQEAEMAAIQQRIKDATRNLDPVARAAAEADLAAAEERHEAERTALKRRQEDEADAFRRRLDNEDKLRDAAIKAKEDELKAFQRALDDVVKNVAKAITDLPKLRDNVTSAERSVQEAFMDQFERALDTVTTGTAGQVASLGRQAGLTDAEVTELINAAMNAATRQRAADRESAGVGNLLNVLSSGLYTIGAGGALGIAAGIDSQAAAIARAMIGSVQAAVNASLAALEIRSPSQVTARLIGAPMAEGIAEGLTATIPEVGSAMTGLLDNVIRGVSIPPSSQLVDSLRDGPNTSNTGFTGPLVTMPGAIIQDATDADLVAQRAVVALQATGVI